MRCAKKAFMHCFNIVAGIVDDFLVSKFSIGSLRHYQKLAQIKNIPKLFLHISYRDIKIDFLFAALRAKIFILVRVGSFGCGHTTLKYLLFN